MLCASRTCGRCGDEQGSPLAVPDEKSRQFEKRLCDFRQARCAFVVRLILSTSIIKVDSTVSVRWCSWLSRSSHIRAHERSPVRTRVEPFFGWRHFWSQGLHTLPRTSYLTQQVFVFPQLVLQLCRKTQSASRVIHRRSPKPQLIALRQKLNLTS